MNNEKRIIKIQKLYIRDNFGITASNKANYSWCYNGIAVCTKVYLPNDVLLITTSIDNGKINHKVDKY